jgi:hypothetical protein
MLRMRAVQAHLLLVVEEEVLVVVVECVVVADSAGDWLPSEVELGNMSPGIVVDGSQKRSSIVPAGDIWLSAVKIEGLVAVVESGMMTSSKMLSSLEGLCVELVS